MSKGKSIKTSFEKDMFKLINHISRGNIRNVNQHFFDFVDLCSVSICQSLMLPDWVGAPLSRYFLAGVIGYAFGLLATFVCGTWRFWSSQSMAMWVLL
jgi:hypothetical protein